MTETTNKTEPRHWLDPPAGWRRFKRLGWVLVACVLAGLLYAAGLTRVLQLPEGVLPSLFRTEPHPDTAQYLDVAPGVALADGFRSYDGVESVSAALTREGIKDWTLLRRKAEKSSKYPPYLLETLEVAEYRHLESEGHLQLLFFNDRLFQAEFIPTEPAAYARRLRRLGMRRDRNARTEKIEGDLRVASTVELAISNVGQNLGTQPFVIWQDLRLVRERDQWDAKFGAIPKRFVKD